jgi:NAD(P)-dependent dehydrogenase (short-subunit alcohol dehydrogenase family)
MPVAIVTGASQGLGRAVAARLAAAGWALVVDARRGAPLEEVAGTLVRQGATLRAVPGDVADPDHRRALVSVAQELGGLDLVVNNAGTLGPSPLPPVARLPLEDLAKLFAVNVIGPLGLVQLSLPLLAKAGGAVVAVTSDAAVEAYEGWAGYGASKSALEQLHHVLEAEAPEIRVYRFDPGDMRTQMHQDAYPGEDISDRPGPEGAAAALLRLITAAPPSGRYRAGQFAEVHA